MSEDENEGGKPPPPAFVDEEAGEKGLGTETGANEPGDDILESDARGARGGPVPGRREPGGPAADAAGR